MMETVVGRKMHQEQMRCKKAVKEAEKRCDKSEIEGKERLNKVVRKNKQSD